MKTLGILKWGNGGSESLGNFPKASQSAVVLNPDCQPDEMQAHLAGKPLDTLSESFYIGLIGVENS